MAKNPKWVQSHSSGGWRGWAIARNEFGEGKRVYGEVRNSPEAAHLDAVKMRMRYAQPIPTNAMGFGAACVAVGDEIHRNRTEGYHSWWQCQRRALEAHFPATRQLEKITPRMIEGFIQKRQADGVSPATINHHLRALSLVMKWAKRQRVIDSDPLDLVQRPKVEQAEMDWFELDELTDLLKGARPYDAAMVRLLALTGLRRSELLRLSWDDVKRDSLWVRGKVRSEEIPLNKGAKEALEVLRGGPMVVHSDTSQPANVVRDVFRRLQRLDSRFKPHAMRHTFGTALVRAGRPMDVVKRLMRVSSVQMVMRYFHHDQQHRSAIEGLSI